ncbi:MAG: UDP-N-acetylmuramoyl-tripeptide--D-alanyl-D-alanine ligase [Oscillibacter sp.]
MPDTLLALKDLAAWYRAQFSIPFVQVTGSVGKTTTKEMIASVLGVKFHTLKTAANYNNEIGTPQTLLGLSRAHQAAVIETGMDRAGQIRYLGEMVKPDIAVITNVGDMHIEYLGSRENILKAKCEIFENLKKDGLAVLNGDDELLNTVSLPQKTLRCGLSEHCDVRVSEVEDLGIDGIRCVVTTAKERYALSIPVPGKHMVYSAAMAAAIGEYLGETKEEIERGAAAYEPAGSRMHVITFSENRRLLDDCYKRGSAVDGGVAARIGRERRQKRLPSSAIWRSSASSPSVRIRKSENSPKSSASILSSQSVHGQNTLQKGTPLRSGSGAWTRRWAPSRRRSRRRRRCSSRPRTPCTLRRS